MPVKASANKNKFVIDTNIQYEKLKVSDYLQKNLPEGRANIQTLNYVLYEFKLGFIRTGINYYALVDSYAGDTSLAKARLSNDIKGRVVKNGVLLLSLIDKIAENMPAAKSKAEKLSMIEAAINFALAVFEVDITNFQGSFASNPIVRFEISSAEDYEQFIDICNTNKIIPMEDFWSKNHATLDKLTSNMAIYESRNNPPRKNYRTMGKHLSKIKLDVKKSSMISVNVGVGDAVIFTDTSRNFTLLTTDNLHTVFALLDPTLEVNKLSPALKSSISP